MMPLRRLLLLGTAIAIAVPAPAQSGAPQPARPAVIDPALVRKYERSEGKGALVGTGPFGKSDRTYRLVRADVVSRVLPQIDRNDRIARTRAFIRHDSERLARAIMFLLESKENARVIMGYD
ncbi:MAG: hypothetical protein KBD19_04070 [Candidatus Moranbacteria bacterium]|nr:hypothetical protein [Candidatus Moranbacteria bacterium]